MISTRRRWNNKQAGVAVAKRPCGRPRKQQHGMSISNMDLLINHIKLWILINSALVASTTNQERELYIAYMGSLPEGEYSPSLHHSRLIKQVVDPSYANKSIIRSYTKNINGFAAYLTAEEREKLNGFDEVISVFPNQKVRPQTTRSWDFMGLPRKTERRPSVESDIIIGVIDHGIWPESESFSDEGFGPIPKKWRGECAGGYNFSCNKKIIGARSYVLGFDNTGLSARDDNGHGTHVASIAAGNEVNANFYGLAQGIARGGVPSARIAVYKVCRFFCMDIDIMSAFQDAIADGVDIISISLGGPNPRELISDPIGIGAFHAMEKDILTVHCAGNSGPTIHTVLDYVPWIFTVGASYTDRRIVDKILLGDGTILVGDSVNAFPSSAAEVPLVYGKEVTRTCSETEAMRCSPSCLDSSMVKQKVVLCDSNVFETVEDPQALGYIIPNKENTSDVVPSRAIVLGTNDINFVKTYKKSAREPVVRFFKSEEIHNPAALLIAPFSSRGPTKSIPDIVKPDVTAPGVEILAAFSPFGPPSGMPYDTRRVKYTILSGTSMACPHVTAVAAFVKSFHPNWSPSALKSALMTTAMEMNAALSTDAEFAYGSGHINPVKATDPGLVYETSPDDYRKIWCHMPNTNCPVNLTHKELNYPSMAVQVETKSAFVVTFPRTVTNVGPAQSTYTVSVTGSHGLEIIVEPNTLQFTTLYQKISFSVTVRGRIISPLTVKSMSLLWTDSIHHVRSPVVVYTTKATSVGGAPPTPPRICAISVLDKEFDTRIRFDLGIPELTGNGDGYGNHLLLAFSHLPVQTTLLDLDYAIRNDEPDAITANSTAEQNATFEKWDKANRLSLMTVKNSIPLGLRGAIPESDKVRDYLKSVEDYFKGSSKAHASSLMLKMLTLKYDESSCVREHIMKMSDMANKLKTLEMEVSNNFIVHFIMTSLPAQFDAFKINYNA
uniref:subtilisin-like protease SBT4.3 n=1 Tax=Erigeron canadensis TaxID=72917 RepID=UPI001CB93E4A|nr:subtilisin-like protease SBT4.3 [Erigeron canadensis]